MNKLVLIFLTISLLLSLQLSYAQSNSISKTDTTLFVNHRYAFKFHPFGLLPLPLSSFKIAVEQKLKNDQHALQYEIAPMFPFIHNIMDSDRYRGMAAIRTSFAYRYYLDEPRQKFNFFAQGQYRTQYESWRLEDWFIRYDGAYEEFLQYNKRIWSNSWIASFGANRRSENSNFFFEWEVGLGTKLRTVYNHGLTSDVIDNSNDNVLLPSWSPMDLESNKTRATTVFLFSLKFGFVLF